MTIRVLRAVGRWRRSLAEVAAGGAWRGQQITWLTYLQAAPLSQAVLVACGGGVGEGRVVRNLAVAQERTDTDGQQPPSAVARGQGCAALQIGQAEVLHAVTVMPDAIALLDPVLVNEQRSSTLHRRKRAPSR